MDQPAAQRKPGGRNPGGPAPPDRDHLLWSLFTFAYLNIFCLGFAALVFSVKSRDRKIVGDVEGARHYASKARLLNIVATVLGILVFIIFIALTFTGMFQVVRVIPQMQDQNNQGRGE